MRARLALTLLLLPSVALAQAQVLTGSASAVDGDTLDMTGLSVRLHGIDAVEASQTCERNAESWACGREAQRLLAGLASRGPAECTQRDIDRYGRIVATCTIRGLDPAEELVRSGLAVALPEFSQAYTAAEAQARSAKRGIWSGRFERPSDFRASDPQASAKERQLRQARNRAVASSARPSVLFRNCDDARAAGAAPLYRGQPGYRAEMDGDDDGVACEPYRGRR